ncbi:MAG: AlpA family phage regulatory protein [Phycisphaerales bacterium]|nr:AlpA family phage regulatory protein [Phycisphaerales bacterium]
MDDARGSNPRHATPLLLTASQAADTLGISRAHLWRLHSAALLPRPLNLGRRCPRWRAAELKEWADAGCPARARWEARAEG